MANRRISELQEQAGLLLADEDLFTLVRVSEPDPALKNKKLTISGTRAYLNIHYLPKTGGTRGSTHLCFHPQIDSPTDVPLLQSSFESQ